MGDRDHVFTKLRIKTPDGLEQMPDCVADHQGDGKARRPINLNELASPELTSLDHLSQPMVGVATDLVVLRGITEPHAEDVAFLKSYFVSCHFLFLLASFTFYWL